MAKQQIALRIICIDPIRQCPGIDAIRFGLQDKKQDLMYGELLSRDEVVFDFTLSVQRDSVGSTNFTGPFAHGTVSKRFVYLTYKVPEGESWQIWRRINVSLTIISWQQVEAALADGRVLQARVSGLRSGTAPLIGGGWLLVD